MGAAPPTGNIYESADGDPQRQYGPGNRLLQKGNTKYEWDADGRLAEKRETTDEGERVWLYAWNGAGLLQSVDTPDGKRVEFAYDPFARRMEKRVARVVDGDVQAQYAMRFVWDGDVLAHEVRTHAAASGDDIVEERAYVFADRTFAPLAHMERAADQATGARRTWFHYVTNGIGTPERLVSGNGEVVSAYRCDAWGSLEPERQGVRGATPLRLQGQYWDEETELFYNRWRYKGTSNAFISPDPVGIFAGTHSYRFAPNAQVLVDPYGLHWAYRLVDAAGNPYYYGHASDKDTLAGVASRHRATSGSTGLRFGPTDRLERIVPRGSSWERVRGIEQAGVAHGGQVTKEQPDGKTTAIGRRKCNGNKVRGNNIRGVSPRNGARDDYKKAADEFLAENGVTNPRNLPTLAAYPPAR